MGDNSEALGERIASIETARTIHDEQLREIFGLMREVQVTNAEMAKLQAVTQAQLDSLAHQIEMRHTPDTCPNLKHIEALSATVVALQQGYWQAKGAMVAIVMLAGLIGSILGGLIIRYWGLHV
jgi:hypothetical protein